MWNAKNMIMINCGTEDKVVVEDNKYGGINEIVKHGACAFIILVNMHQRVWVHNTHVAVNMSNNFKICRMFEYMLQHNEFLRR